MQTQQEQPKAWRGYLALWAAKIARRGLLMLGKRATQVPGRIALRIEPNFLSWIRKPEKRFGITGTNGKTTTTNMIASICEANGLRVACNRFGSNLKSGICAALIAETSWRNRAKADVFIVEVDEVSSPTYLPQLRVQGLLVTNLFRDQYERIGHVGQLVRRLNQAITDEVTLILNGDDVQQLRLGTENNRRLWYRVSDDPEGDVEKLLQAWICPICHEPMEILHQQYQTIGRYRCPTCDQANPKPHYEITSFSAEASKFSFRATGREPSEEGIFYFPIRQTFDLYNLCAVLSAVDFLALSWEMAQDVLSAYSSFQVRYEQESFGAYRVTKMLNKGKTPVSISHVLYYAAHHGPSTLILLDQDFGQAPQGYHNMAWLYDADFSAASDPAICDIVVCGERFLDYDIALRLQNAPMEKVHCFRTIDEAAALIIQLPCKNLCLTYDLDDYSIEQGRALWNRIKESVHEN